MSEIFAFAPPLPTGVVSLAVVPHMVPHMELYSARAVISTGNQETCAFHPAPRFVQFCRMAMSVFFIIQLCLFAFSSYVLPFIAVHLMEKEVFETDSLFSPFQTLVCFLIIYSEVWFVRV